MKQMDLSIDFLGVHFENPFCLSSSPVGNCYEMCAKAFDTGWGGIVYKTLHTDDFVVDEVSPRFDELTKEATPFVAFKNMEQIAEHPLAQDLADITRLKKEHPNKIIIASIMGQNESNWTELAKKVEEAGADMIEMNLSCPQMTSHTMGSDVGENPDLCCTCCTAVKRGSKLPVLAKMTPNITDMTEVAKACMEGGADGISAINTVKSIANVDLDRHIGMPIVNSKSAVSGLSGKAVKPISLRFIQQMRVDPDLKDLPISGIGGIETWRDAAEYILMGATTLQVTTAVMQYGYRIVEDMKDGLSHYMRSQGVKSLFELVGLAVPNTLPADSLDRDFKVYPVIDTDKCIHCGRCYISCYDGAHQAIQWDPEERKVSIDKDKCVGCHLCRLVCPVHAISMDKPEMKPGRKGDPDKIVIEPKDVMYNLK